MQVGNEIKQGLTLSIGFVNLMSQFTLEGSVALNQAKPGCNTMKKRRFGCNLLQETWLQRKDMGQGGTVRLNKELYTIKTTTKMVVQGFVLFYFVCLMTIFGSYVSVLYILETLP